MTESLFDNNPQSQTPPQVDDYIAELTKPGSKFDRTKYQSDSEMYQAIAKGKYEADLMISLKNRETDDLYDQNKRLRDEYNAGPKLQEVLDRILTAQNTSTSSTHTQANDNKDTAQGQAFDPSQLDSLLEDKLSKIEQARLARANWETVRDRLQSQFGDRSSEVLKAQTQKLGLTTDKVEDLAKTSPAAFFKLLGLDEQPKAETFQAPPRSSQSMTFAPRSNQRTWAHWREEQRKNPSLFSDPKAHNQMMDDIKAIGEKAFYGP